MIDDGGDWRALVEHRKNVQMEIWFRRFDVLIEMLREHLYFLWLLAFVSQTSKNRSDSTERRVRDNLSSRNWLPFCVIEGPTADEDFGARNWPFVKLIAEWISCTGLRL